MTNIKDIWFAVVNPNAGSGKTMSEWNEAERLLFARGIKYVFATPVSLSDSYNKILDACATGYRRFIAVGGDGTVHNLLKAIVNFVENSCAEGGSVRLDDFTLTVLPIGSGNDWLRSHNIPRDHSRIVELMSEGRFGRQDVVRADILDRNGNIANTAYMANIGGYCFDAGVCSQVNFQKSRGVTGKMLYLRAVIYQAYRIKSSPTKVICDGKEFYDGLVFTMSFGNGKYSGGGLCQTPSAVMDDGLLDVMMAPKFPIYKLFLNINKLLRKDLERVPFIKFTKASDIKIIPTGKRGELVEIDGEVIGRAPLHLSVLPQQINVLHLDERP